MAEAPGLAPPAELTADIGLMKLSEPMDVTEEAMPFPVNSPKLSDLECSLALLELLLDVAICSGGSLFWVFSCVFIFSCGVPIDPMGVAIRNAGSCGLPSIGTSEVPFTTGRTFGLGGMARPRAGLRGPLFLPPGVGSRSKGTGAGLDIVGCGGGSVGLRGAWEEYKGAEAAPEE